MLELNRNTAASLLTEGHVFCAGSLAQCLNRWNRLSNDEKAATFLKIGRDGVSPTIVRGDELAALADNSELLYL
jgi:hypothetical protein